MSPTVAAFVAGAADLGGVRSKAVTRPAGARAGDLLVLQFWMNAIDAPPTVTGWTQVRQASGATDPDGMMAIWSRTDDGSTGPWTVTWNGTLVIVDWLMFAVRDSAGINASGIQANAASRSLTAPSITTSTADCLLTFVGSPSNFTTITPPGGFTEVVEDEVTYLATASQPAAGASGAKAASMADALSSLGALLAFAPTVTPGAPMAYSAGFARQADGTLSMTTDATGATWQAGFLRSPSGALVVTSSAPLAQGSGGHWLDASGALAIALDAAGRWDVGSGFLRTSTGALCVTSTGPFTDQMGFQRDTAGRLAATIA